MCRWRISDVLETCRATLLASDGELRVAFVQVSDFAWNPNDDWVMASVAEDNILQVGRLGLGVMDGCGLLRVMQAVQHSMRNVGTSTSASTPALFDSSLDIMAAACALVFSIGSWV
jgi:hypothetical protein